MRFWLTWLVWLTILAVFVFPDSFAVDIQPQGATGGINLKVNDTAKGEF